METATGEWDVEASPNPDIRNRKVIVMIMISHRIV
jgi:hypothetical protein